MPLSIPTHMLTPSEAAEILRISDRTMRLYIETGRIGVTKLSRVPGDRKSRAPVLIHPDDLANFIETRRIEARTKFTVVCGRAI